MNIHNIETAHETLINFVIYKHSQDFSITTTRCCLLLKTEEIRPKKTHQKYNQIKLPKNDQ